MPRRKDGNAQRDHEPGQVGEEAACGLDVAADEIANSEVGRRPEDPPERGKGEEGGKVVAGDAGEQTRDGAEMGYECPCKEYRRASPAAEEAFNARLGLARISEIPPIAFDE